MADWGEVEMYTEMIADLNTFCVSVDTACETLKTAATICASEMQNDIASLKASKNVLLSTKKYEEAKEMAQKLAVALEEERRDLVEYLKTLEEMDEV